MSEARRGPARGRAPGRRGPASAKLADRRIRLILLALLGLFGIVLLRTFWLQTVSAHKLGTLAARPQNTTVELPASRGSIVDRTGAPLAIGEQAITVYANPREIRDPRAVALAAQQTLGVDASRLVTQLADRSKGFVYVARQADPVRARTLQRRGLRGLGFYREERRVYPQGSVAAQILGYAGIDGKGLAGVELELEKSLAGKPGLETYVRDPAGRPLDIVRTKPEQDGRTVRLTIDHTIQANAEAVLASTLAKWKAKSGTAIVLDPRTGAIRAMAVSPGYDANAFPQAPAPLQRNPAVTDTYEPGSTFKVVTVGAALSERLVAADTSFTLPYSIEVADRTIHDAEPRGTVTYTVGQILSHSSNVGAITLAKLLGPNRVADWIERWGFGSRTGIDFPGESPGIVLPVDRWSGSTIGNVPIGQGIAVTPLQMAAAYGAIANGGTLVRPHLVEGVAGERRQRPEKRRILTAAVADQLRSMLVNVVAEGTGTLAAVSGYDVAGKTGTAAKPDPVKGGYSDTRYVASFVGMVPAHEPRLVILVAIDEPQGAIWGGVVAAPAFSQIARFDLQYLNVPPDPHTDAPSPPTVTGG